MIPQLIYSRAELDALDPDTMLVLRPPHPPRTAASLIDTLTIAPELDWLFPVAVIATGDHVRTALTTLEEMNG